MERKPVLGIFLGEAAGIGPELVAKVVADGTVSWTKDCWCAFSVECHQ